MGMQISQRCLLGIWTSGGSPSARKLRNDNGNREEFSAKEAILRGESGLVIAQLHRSMRHVHEA